MIGLVFALASVVSLALNTFDYMFPKYDALNEVRERELEIYSAFHSSAHEIGSFLSEQNGAATGISMLFLTSKVGHSRAWTNDFLIQIMRLSSSRVRGFGFIPKNATASDENGNGYYVYREYGNVVPVDGATDWELFMHRTFAGVPPSEKRASWRLMLSPPVSGTWDPTALLITPAIHNEVEDGWIVNETSLSWLKSILLNILKTGVLEAACIFPGGKVCTIRDNELVIHDATGPYAVVNRMVDSHREENNKRNLRLEEILDFRDEKSESEIGAIEVLDTGLVLVMRRKLFPPNNYIYWHLTAVLAILAVATFSADWFFSRRRIRLMNDTEYLNRMARKSAEKTPSSGLAPARFRSGTTTRMYRQVKTYYTRFVPKMLGLPSGREMQDRMESELRVARQIQFSLVPTRFPTYSEWREFDLYAYLAPAREVGGDYYDFFMKDANRIVFAVGDVSGKGVPAAMYMAVCRTAFRTLARHAQQPGELLTRLNELLIHDNHSKMYVTITCFFVDLPSGKCYYSLGGHPAPLLHRRETGEIEMVDSPRETFIGLKAGVEYPVGEVLLNRGDTILLYSDGVTESCNEKGDDLGIGRLKDMLKENAAAKSCKNIISNLEIRTREYIGNHEQNDDITLLAFRYWGPGGQKVNRDSVRISYKHDGNG